MKLKRVLHHILFPHVAVMTAAVPIAAAFLVWAMLNKSSASPLAVASYVTAFYTLGIWCMRLPTLVTAVKSIKSSNKYIRIWHENTRLRVGLSLSASLLWNLAYSALQFALGVYYRSLWYFSFGFYYALLAAVRLSLAFHTRKYVAGERMREELRKYRACGIALLVMELALSAVMLVTIRGHRSVAHHEVVVIAMAAYTFTTFTLALVNTVRYRKYNSPVYSASKVISLVAGCVSLITLEDTMLATFSSGNMTPRSRVLFLALTGGAVSVFLILAAIRMIIGAADKLKHLPVNGEKDGE